jgi:hypothetical protein
MTARKTADEFRRDAELCARQSMDLRETANGLLDRAEALERPSKRFLGLAARAPNAGNDRLRMTDEKNVITEASTRRDCSSNRAILDP